MPSLASRMANPARRIFLPIVLASWRGGLLKIGHRFTGVASKLSPMSADQRMIVADVGENRPRIGARLCILPARREAGESTAERRRVNALARMAMISGAHGD